MTPITWPGALACHVGDQWCAPSGMLYETGDSQHATYHFGAAHPEANVEERNMDQIFEKIIISVVTTIVIALLSLLFRSVREALFYKRLEYDFHYTKGMGLPVLWDIQWEDYRLTISTEDVSNDLITLSSHFLSVPIIPLHVEQAQGFGCGRLRFPCWPDRDKFR